MSYDLPPVQYLAAGDREVLFTMWDAPLRVPR